LDDVGEIQTLYDVFYFMDPADVSVLNCQANFLKYGSKFMFKRSFWPCTRLFFWHIVHLYHYCRFFYSVFIFLLMNFWICMFYQCVGE